MVQIEVATCAYPYDQWKDPFHQIKQVVNGPPPTIPDGKYSPELQQFVAVWYVKTQPHNILYPHEVLIVVVKALFCFQFTEASGTSCQL